MNATISKLATVAALTSVLAGGAVLVGQQAANADDGTGVVAQHTGRWGYNEIVFGKSTTRRIATSSIWDIGSLVGGPAVAYLGSPAAQLVAIPGGVYLWTVKWRAQDALNTGQCFSLVRPFYGSPGFAAKTWQGCR